MTYKPVPLSIDDRTLFHSYLEKYPPVISELTFTNLFVWRNYRPVWWLELCDSLVIIVASFHGKSRGRYILGPPVGPAQLTDILHLLEGTIQGVIRLPDNSIQGLQSTGKPVSFDRDNSDYVYRVSDLAALRGRHFSKKRNHIKQCLAHNACEYEEITPGIIPDCLSMQDTWCHERQCDENISLCNENIAIQELYENYEKLDLLGGVVRVNGQIMAYAIGEKLNENTAVWHFEKAMPTVPGLGQLINQWFSKYSLQAFEYVNREQDLGISGLRQAKESYYPHHMVDKYNFYFAGQSYSGTASVSTC